jgi:uncharacterized membrane protein YccC
MPMSSAESGVARSDRLVEAFEIAVPPLLFGFRLWASVCLTLYVVFWLELDTPAWAAASAAIVCQPQLGASLRKGWGRMIGTVIGAIMIVVITAIFPQDRVAFLMSLALWAALCAFGATLLRNFASYAAALAGYTAAIIAADTLGAVGGPNTDVFILAVNRASEICIGIVCAGIVLAGTDLGNAQRQLATSFATLSADIASAFIGMLGHIGPVFPDTRQERRELARRVIALDPQVDQAIGESGELRYRLATLQTAVRGLLGSLDGWRGVVTHLVQSPRDSARQDADAILLSLPAPLRSVMGSRAPSLWMADAVSLRGHCEAAIQRLLASPVATPSLRLLADETAKLLTGLLESIEALVLLAGGKPSQTGPSFRKWMRVPDRLPALLNAARAFATICAVELFWVVSGWPDGTFSIAFAAIVVLLLSPRGDLAFAGAIAFLYGTAATIVLAAIIAFAVLPGLETFAAFCLAIGLYYVPVGYLLAHTRNPAALAMLTALAVSFMPILAPTNHMTYNTTQFYNGALAILVGSAVAAISFRLIPPLSPEVRTRRLLTIALQDLRRLATGRLPQQVWKERMFGALAALPDQAQPLRRAQLLAAMAVGNELLALRRLCAQLGFDLEFKSVLVAVTEGNSAAALTNLASLDAHLAPLAHGEPAPFPALRARAKLLVLSEALTQHSEYFDAGARA